MSEFDWQNFCTMEQMGNLLRLMSQNEQRNGNDWMKRKQQENNEKVSCKVWQQLTSYEFAIRNCSSFESLLRF